MKKNCPGVKALTDISLDFFQGEVHALLGENGAGKSTLIKIISGVYQKDSGEMLFQGKECCFANAKQAIKSGISVIHQELSIVPDLTVGENIYLGREMKKHGPFLDKKTMNRQVAEILQSLDMKIKPTDRMSTLNTAQKQMVEIAKAVSQNAKVVIMDEPTSSLSDYEVEALFKVIAKLKKEQVAIVYISHRLKELFEIGDKVSILRDGHYVKTLDIKQTNEKELVSLMVGREIRSYLERTELSEKREVLSLNNVSREPDFRQISLTVNRGEIVGIAGLIGAGRTEVLRGIFGMEPFEQGEMRLYGQPVHMDNPRQAIKAGIGLVPEDRRNQGLMLDKSVKDNLTLPSIKRESKHGFVDKEWETANSREYVKVLSIKTPDITTEARNLSGGNQQKIVIAKWLLAGTKILLLDEPTQGN